MRQLSPIPTFFWVLLKLCRKRRKEDHIPVPVLPGDTENLHRPAVRPALQTLQNLMKAPCGEEDLGLISSSRRCELDFNRNT